MSDSADGAQSPGAPSQHGGDIAPPSARPLSGGDGGVTDTAGVSEETAARLQKVMHSEIGATTLLTRLKQSIASARDFATFLKKRAALEEEHAQGLRKLARAGLDSAHKPEHRQGSYSRSYEEVNRIHERMADHGQQFAVSLQQMSEDLQELATNIEKGRKHWKQTALSAEKKVQEAENAAEKAKAKYDTLAEQYDRVRTGDKQSGKFGLKGHKSAAQHEEELLRKVQNADNDYSSKVSAAQAARQELVSTLRPQAVQNIRQLTTECDSGLTLQLQKFASFNEKLLLGTGLCVSPLKDAAAGPKSLREVIHQIDNQKDFNDYVLSHSGNPGAVTAPEVKYEPHPTLAPNPPPAAPPASQQSPLSKRQSTLMLSSPTTSQPPASSPKPGPQPSQNLDPIPPLAFQQQPDSLPSPQQYSQRYLPPGPSQPPYPVSQPLSPQDRLPAQHGNGYQPPSLPPVKPVFGVSLEDLYRRDGTAVPMIVYQCFQAVELFGLDVEGIYRLSGSANHINHMKALFDNDSTQVDFTNPDSFHHDVNSVAGLLKQFLRELPEPLFTTAYYSDFINAARIDDDIQRRDSLHAIINNLPDPHYATLRALILHLNKVQEHYATNRMNAGNLAICFGPTLLGANSGGNIADAGWQARVIETILLNTFQIFDDD
ncbi:hypothetical protein DTO021C3_6196 [Paecilomyces variotii]|nr:hypothetical protein DTO021C3_6196 [Paecilomyces variotii]